MKFSDFLEEMGYKLNKKVLTTKWKHGIIKLAQDIG